MRRFTSKEIEAFLKEVDRHVDGPFEVEVIGGAAGMLSFNLERDTEDIDTITSVTRIKNAIEAGRFETGLNIPMDVAGVWDGPYEYRSRRIRVRLPGVKNLIIYVPEKHDWALMKIMRLKDKDRRHIKEVFGKVGFDPDVFLDRFLSEMTHVIGRKRDILVNFVLMMSLLYGEQEAVRMQMAVENDKRWKEDLKY